MQTEIPRYDASVADGGAATAICSKSRWGRIILRRTACFAWMWCWMANGS